MINMLFTFADVSTRFESYLLNWMENSNRLKPVYDLYFGIVHNPSTYLIHAFLSQIQALETYHRRLASKYEFTDDAKNEIAQEVVKRSSHNYELCKLQSRKDPPLLMRIIELLKVHQDVVHPVIEYHQHVQFAEFLKDARNYYTHLEPRKDSTAPTRNELWEANQRMKILLQACLLLEIGMNKDQTKRFFSSSREFKTLVHTLHLLSQHVIDTPLHRL